MQCHYQPITSDNLDTFDPGDIYPFYAINGFKITYTETSEFRQSSSIQIDSKTERRIRFTSSEDSKFDVNEELNDRKVLSANVLILGQEKPV